MNSERSDLVESLAHAIERFPCSRRTLAREAGVGHSTLNRIVRGQVRTVEPATARRIATALDDLSRRLGEDGQRVREALPTDGPPSEQEAPDG